jgi:hypothetical protein
MSAHDPAALPDFASPGVPLAPLPEAEPAALDAVVVEDGFAAFAAPTKATKSLEDEPLGYWLGSDGRITTNPANAVAPAQMRSVAVAPAQLATPSAPTTSALDRSHPVGTNILAVLALVFGLVGGSIVPVVLGHIARNQIRETGERGDGMAIAGMVLGYLGLASLAVLVIASAVLAAR